MPLPIPEAILRRLHLSKIKPRHSYLDRKATEQGTQVTKRKYRLAGLPLTKQMGVHPFFVLTSNAANFNPTFSIKVEPHEWEHRVGQYLEKTSYIDLRKMDALSEDSLVEKMNDPENKFPYTGKLSQTKFEELQALRSRVPRAHATLTRDTQQMVVQALSEADIADKVLGDLGLL